MYRIAICDDEITHINKTENITINFCNSISMPVHIKTYINCELLLFDLQEGLYYDIFLLDIEMPQRNGLELASQIRKKSQVSIIILITSHLQYAIDAFPLLISHYIPKSTITDRLPVALKDTFHFLSLQNDKYYILDSSSKYQRIPYKKILYIYKNQKNSVFVLNDTELRERISLENLFANLSHEDFIFIERGYIVNILHIMKLENCELVLENGTKLHVSRSHLTAVKRAITLYWGRNV